MASRSPRVASAGGTFSVRRRGRGPGACSWAHPSSHGPPVGITMRLESNRQERDAMGRWPLTRDGSVQSAVATTLVPARGRGAARSLQLTLTRCSSIARAAVGCWKRPRARVETQARGPSGCIPAHGRLQRRPPRRGSGRRRMTDGVCATLSVVVPERPRADGNQRAVRGRHRHS